MVFSSISVTTTATARTTATTTATSTTDRSATFLMCKADEIQAVVSAPTVDLWKLRELALSEGGLVNDSLRRIAWPILLGVHEAQKEKETEQTTTTPETTTTTTTTSTLLSDNKTLRSSISLPPRVASVDEGDEEAEAVADDDEDADVEEKGSALEDAAFDSTTLPPLTRTSGGGAKASSSFSASNSSLNKNNSQKSINNNSGLDASWTQVSVPSDNDNDDEDVVSTHSVYSSSASTVSIVNTTTNNTSSQKRPKGRRSSSSSSLRVVASSWDARQIELDVHRCTWHLLTGNQRAQRLQMEHKHCNRAVARLIRRKQRRLANLINLTLLHTYTEPQLEDDPDRLRYYQGYHDVACIFLSALGGSGNPRGVPFHAADANNNNNGKTSTSNNTASVDAMAMSLGIDLPTKLLGRISQSHFRDCMKTNFIELQTALRLTVMPLLLSLDTQVHDYLADAGMEPFFVLSWVITWFSHDVRDTEAVKRLFDAFLVAHPLFPVYLSIAMMLHPHNRHEILQTECDFALLHQTLRGLPRNSSMVGWKYRPGDGYVSDDAEDDDSDSDDDDDDNPLGLSSRSSNIDGDFAMIRAEILDKGQEPASTQSSVSTCGDSTLPGETAPVPFEELLSLALKFMEQWPPSQLSEISMRYYGKEAFDAMMAEAPDMMMLDADPPEWSVLASTSQGRDLRGVTEDAEETTNKAETNEDPKKQFDKAAVIALGLAPGSGGADAARERRRKRFLRAALWTAVTVAVVAVAVGVVLQYQQQQQQQLPTKEPPQAASRSRNQPQSSAPPRDECSERKASSPVPIPARETAIAIPWSIGSTPQASDNVETQAFVPYADHDTVAYETPTQSGRGSRIATSDGSGDQSSNIIGSARGEMFLTEGKSLRMEEHSLNMQMTEARHNKMAAVPMSQFSTSLGTTNGAKATPRSLSSMGATNGANTKSGSLSSMGMTNGAKATSGSLSSTRLPKSRRSQERTRSRPMDDMAMVGKNFIEMNRAFVREWKQYCANLARIAEMVAKEVHRMFFLEFDLTRASTVREIRRAAVWSQRRIRIEWNHTKRMALHRLNHMASSKMDIELMWKSLANSSQILSNLSRTLQEFDGIGAARATGRRVRGAVDVFNRPFQDAMKQFVNWLNEPLQVQG